MAPPSILAAVVACMAAACVLAQDPPQGWLGYATATYPSGTMLTRMEASWVVPPNPKKDGLFFGYMLQ